MKSKQDVADIMETIFQECRALREAGQKEYAHSNENALSNFEKLASDLQITREKILLIYFKKHYDGVVSWVNGHKSQREDVRGRINDMIAYLCLLRAMVEDAPQKHPATAQG